MPHDAAAFRTTTPIKHLVVLFDENISFDHYFGTYPNAAKTDGSPFHAAPDTPKVNGLDRHLLDHNPNAFNPRRLSSSQALTCDQDHGYGDEQRAFDLGKMDKFVEFTHRDSCSGQPPLFSEPGLVMDYYDGNTVTALWNYAQHFAMSDNSYYTVFGPSTPGAVNLISGQTHGIHGVNSRTGDPVSDPSVVQSPDANGVGTVVNDPDPAFDDCSDNNHSSINNLGVMTGPNIGDLLNRQKSPGAGSRAASTPPARGTASPSAAPATRTSAATRWSTTARTTSRSSTTRRPATPSTSRPARWRRSATPTRPTTSTT